MHWCFKLLLVIVVVISTGYGRLSMNTPPRSFKVVDVSPSGKSIRVDRGYFDNIRNGDQGEFYIGTDKSLLVGYAEAVKVDNATSHWYIRKVVLGGALKKGKKIIYFNTKSKRKVISKDFRNEKDDIEYIEREHY